jgi:hypothetical protein
VTHPSLSRLVYVKHPKAVSDRWDSHLRFLYGAFRFPVLRQGSLPASCLSYCMSLHVPPVDCGKVSVTLNKMTYFIWLFPSQKPYYWCAMCERLLFNTTDPYPWGYERRTPNLYPSLCWDHNDLQSVGSFQWKTWWFLAERRGTYLLFHRLRVVLFFLMLSTGFQRCSEEQIVQRSSTTLGVRRQLLHLQLCLCVCVCVVYFLT